MVMTTFEYRALLAQLKQEQKDNNIEKNKENEYTFKTWKEPGIIYDEWGNSHLGIVEKTGFEGDGA